MEGRGWLEHHVGQLTWPPLEVGREAHLQSTRTETEALGVNYDPVRMGTRVVSQGVEGEDWATGLWPSWKANPRGPGAGKACLESRSCGFWDRKPLSGTGKCGSQ